MNGERSQGNLLHNSKFLLQLIALGFEGQGNEMQEALGVRLTLMFFKSMLLALCNTINTDNLGQLSQEADSKPVFTSNTKPRLI